MIQYRISYDDLTALLGEAWMKKAKRRTNALRKAGQFNESSSIWSEIKHHYMTLQGESKCAFCERKLESVEYGKGEQDVEHFRPKGNVKAWSLPAELSHLGINFAVVKERNFGFYLLAYHPFNYCASCKPCNSALKSSYFPIAGTYDFATEDPRDLAEQHYLIYPIGDFDRDSEDLIGFYGVSPIAKTAPGHHDHLRAVVTIEFFKLNDAAGRKNLFRERAQILITLYSQLKVLKDRRSSAGDKADAEQLIQGFTSPISAHTNCARSFVALFNDDPAEAQDLFRKAKELVISIS